MALGRFKIGQTTFTFVFRHRFEPANDYDYIGKFKYHSEFRDWELGMWFRKTKMVGKKNFKHPNEWKHNLVDSRMLGINLLICKAWVEWNRGGMHIDVDL